MLRGPLRTTMQIYAVVGGMLGASAALVGCQTLNANNGLDGVSLSALDDAPASRIDSTAPSLDASLDRSGWPAIVVAVPIRQAAHRPTYAPLGGLSAGAGNPPRGGWRDDTFPTTRNVLMPARYDQDSAAGAAGALAIGVGLVVWAPIDAIFNRRPPWAIERSPAMSYERVPGPPVTTFEDALADDAQPVPFVMLILAGRLAPIRRGDRRLPKGMARQMTAGLAMCLAVALALVSGCSDPGASGPTTADAVPDVRPGSAGDQSAMSDDGDSAKPPGSGQPDAAALVEELDKIDAQFAEVLDALITDDGRVRYGLLRSDRSLLDALGDVTDGYAAMARPANRYRHIALLSNAYNANMILHAFIESRRPGFVTIAQVPGFFTEPRLNVIDQQVSFHGLEQEILREAGRGMLAARLHAALVRAAVSAPPMRATPYTASRLEEQLEDQARRWVNDSRLNRATADDAIGISVIFDWYREDFESAAADAGVGTEVWTDGVLYFLREHAAPDSSIGRVLEATDSPTIMWEIYDWSLNDAAARSLSSPDPRDATDDPDRDGEDGEARP